MFTWWAEEPYKKAAQALDAYRKLLRERVLGIRPGEEEEIVGTPIGREALATDLNAELIAYTPEELLAIGEREYAWCEAEMKKAAKEHGELVVKGKKMTNRQFHDTIIQGGNLPVEMVRARLTQQTLTRDHDASWKPLAPSKTVRR